MRLTATLERAVPAVATEAIGEPAAAEAQHGVGPLRLICIEAALPLEGDGFPGAGDLAEVAEEILALQAHGLHYDGGQRPAASARRRPGTHHAFRGRRRTGGEEQSEKSGAGSMHGRFRNDGDHTLTC